ncbi:hypothetical protein [Embleya sp. NPDC001921]
MNAYVAWSLVLFLVLIAVLGPRFGADTRDGADWSRPRGRPEVWPGGRVDEPATEEPATGQPAPIRTTPATTNSDGWSALPGRTRTGGPDQRIPTGDLLAGSTPGRSR